MRNEKKLVIYLYLQMFYTYGIEYQFFIFALTYLCAIFRTETEMKQYMKNIGMLLHNNKCHIVQFLLPVGSSGFITWCYWHNNLLRPCWLCRRKIGQLASIPVWLVASSFWCTTWNYIFRYRRSADPWLSIDRYIFIIFI